MKLISFAIIHRVSFFSCLTVQLSDKNEKCISWWIDAIYDYSLVFRQCFFFYLIIDKFHFGSRSSIIFSLHNFIGFNFLYSSFFVDIPKALIKCMHNIWIKTFFLRDKYSSLINFIFFICVWCHFLYWMSLDRFYLSFRKVEERRKCWRKWFHFGVWRRKMSYSGFFTQRLTQNEKKDES